MGPELVKFLNYWRSLGGGTQVPARNRLDLRQLASTLRWMFILEMASDGTLKFRLAGSALEEAFGVAMTDRPYSDIFSFREDQDLAEEVYAVSVVRGCGLLRLGFMSFEENQHQPLEVLALPFADARVMGGIVMVAVVQPFAFENIANQDTRDLVSMGVDDIYLIPSPHVVTPLQLPDRLRSAMTAGTINIRAIDSEGLSELSQANTISRLGEIPSVSLEQAAAQQLDVPN
ncbi:MAG: PAS domain-containing protein [Kordiimonadaceae bacterium]|nr:PAS domain-containing protein [Kordiimonadaceae bacterium]MBO6567195.1 PAS domain-containing protein [Kordiimonadaceae bacterium]MBO6963590.1 PAS domain-containing protein [Kordiimonadaceae bacterium]